MNEQARLEVVNTVEELEKAVAWETVRKANEQGALDRCVDALTPVSPSRHACKPD